MLAPEFQGVDELGAILTRDQYLTTMKSEDLVVKSIKLSEFRARDYGEVTVLTLIVGGQATYKGKDDSNDTRTTLVFVKRDGRWQCVASHASLIARPA